MSMSPRQQLIKHQWVVTVARWVKPCLALALLFLLIPPRFNHPFYDSMLFTGIACNDSEYPSEIEGIKRQIVSIPVHHQNHTESLHGWLFEKPGATQIALVHHGQGGSIGQVLQFAYYWLKMNRSVLLYDYEGYGDSSGKPSIEGLCRDGQTAYRWLVEQKHFAPDQIINVGVSLGTGVASTVARENPCAGVILLSPYASLRAIAQRHLPWLRIYGLPAFKGHVDWLIDYPDIGSQSLLSGPHPPALLIAGTDDFILPIDQADELAKNARQPLTYLRLERAGHTDFFGKRSLETMKAIQNFMDELHRQALGSFVRRMPGSLPSAADSLSGSLPSAADSLSTNQNKSNDGTRTPAKSDAR